MAKKSNKTSHVLSLIANKPDETSSNSVYDENNTKKFNKTSRIEVENNSENNVSEIIKKELEKSISVDNNSIGETNLSNENKLQTKNENKENFVKNNNENLNQTNDYSNINNNEPVKSIKKEPPYYNLAEGLVKSKVIPTMKKLGMCTCEKCTNDVIALTLNMLPPMYVSSDAGQLFAKLNSYEKQYSTDLLSAVLKACIQVEGNSRHK
ncbi:late competence development ComFB family protein [Anaerovorax odorimutans]|uniref:late competence development ComFB family protein n=1 Tax=Anaerovorax odorimutans TaxID=109327 RepID=UPI00041626E4|nr:late competence development ComFB family protein [Anaerovorax odorimutans]